MIDLLVVGGGPAGMATALFAARAGLSTAIVEQRPGTIDKACGEGIFPGAVRLLGELGVDPLGMPFRGIRYTDGRRSAEALFPHGPGRGVRRTTLHAALADRVRSLGIPVYERKAGPVDQDESSVTVAGLTARYLAAADGLHSPIRDQLGLAEGHHGQRRFGQRRHYPTAPWADLVEVHWSPRAEAYVTPVAPDLVGVAILSDQRTGFGEQLGQFPALRDRLPPAESPVRGAGPLRQRVRARVAGRVLLVGDAAGYVDALTGEGISVSLACARDLVDSVLAGRPADYERSWLRSSRRYRWITETLLWTRNRPLLARSIVPAASLLPPVFGAAVGQLAR